MTLKDRSHVVWVAFALASCAAIVLGAVAAKPADAASQATIRSATIKVGAETLTIDLVVNSRYVRKIDGAIQAIVTLPRGTTGSVVATDQGFNGRGWSIAFRNGTARDSGVLSVTVPARNTRIQTAVGLASDTGWAVEAPGTTNQATLIQFFKGTLPIA